MAAMEDPRHASRRSIRLRGYDYASSGAYLVTVCSHGRLPIFGQIVEGEMRASAIGAIVEEEWNTTAQLRSGVLLDAFVLMPNHLHGIVILNLRDDLPGGDIPRTGGLAVPSRGIGAIVSGFKAAVSSTVAKQELSVSRPVWQRGFHDRIIRDERELQQFREYIANNPLQWELDRYFEQGIGGTEV
jgi:putative transposase